MKFNTNMLFFSPSKHAGYVRKLCLCRTQRKSPRKLWSADRAQKKEKIRPKFLDIFCKTVEPSGEKSGKAPYL